MQYIHNPFLLSVDCSKLFTAHTTQLRIPAKGKDTDQTTHLEFDFGSSSDHAEAEGRHVNSPITFPKDEKLILCEIGELGKKTQQGLVIILGNLKEPHVKS